MSECNTLFRQRIGVPASGNITFDMLGAILEKTAENIPFENLCVIQNQTYDITKENLVHKILVKKEGGLCYELNAILYFFLAENGFDVVLARGVVYDHAAQDYQTLDRTHVTILTTYEDQMYVIDTGFGGNLPLKPVPFGGETTTSRNGEFRIKRENSEHGNYVFHMKLKHTDTRWRIGYAFDSGKTFTEVSECNEICAIISENSESKFNKTPLITKLTSGGTMTLTRSTLTQWNDGFVTKEKIDSARFNKLLKQHFGLSAPRL